ncbi:hypothetical protein N7462_005821 [Penicillium macrosclerotiorum]|uniref:uncharacterized protein n=1 Tax=Penicillium macrosclerotiorum TaxID=303699 RepID=UPI0025465ECC|nr:uncharacterized protein N7462_005821 [Penicillium macrosclerotiorum]KAJ5682656.1 hypothetical protein N7462_005821 [Penicillium macrosclerotiorum]
MKGFFRSLGSRRSSSDSSPDHSEDSPESVLLQEMKTFCEGTNSPQTQQGNEFVHLPRIVETAESSPAAAKEAAHRIKKYLSSPSNTPNHVQYNAIMVMRILVDNPGHSFTRNFDSKFVTVIKELLRNGRDWHVQHYLRQYLNTLEANRAGDEDLQLLLQMWAKEKTKGNQSFIDRYPTASAQQGNPMAAHPYPSRPPLPPKTLPEPGELAARIEEAKNSAKLLTQFVQTTPQAELEGNELVKEFVDRCRTSSRLLQTYIHSTNPTPDEDTLLTLIETNDEISVAISQQQRAMLKARKARGASSPASQNVNSPTSSNSEAVASGAAHVAPAPAPAVTAVSANIISPVDLSMPNLQTPEHQSDSAGERTSTVMSGGRPNAARPNTDTFEYNSADYEVQNPFADDFATHDSEHERTSHPATTVPGSRMRLEPTEQER